jgi:hypothetical protein
MNGAAVYSGISVEVDISVPNSFWSSAQDGLNAIVAQINGDGLLQVTDATLTLGTQIDVLDALTGGGNWSAVMHVIPNTSTDVGTIQAQITSDIATVTQSTNFTVAVPYVANTPTGQTGGSVTPGGAFGSIGSTISNFFSGLQSTTTTLIIGAVIVLVLVLVLVAYGPNVGKIASAVA